MNVREAIRTRRSIGRVKDELPPKADIEAMLDGAVYAPNHHLTEPWRFFVLTGKAREELGEVFAEVTRERLMAQGGEVTPAKLDAERRKPLRAPVLIAVASVPQEGAIGSEELQATAAAIQNMLLIAHERGLAAIWRTGGFAYEPAVKAFFDLPEEAELAGFLYVGYANMDPPENSRTPYEEKTTWLGLTQW